MKPDTKRAIPLVVFSVTVLLFLFLYSAKGSGEFQITTDPHNQSNPAIYKDIVVWEDERNGNKDIYGYNLSTQEEFLICIDPSDQYYPAIYGDIVVWEDHRNDNWDIYGYNLSTREEFQITTHESIQSDPKIYKDMVVWEEWRYGKDIYGLNLATKEEFQITTAPHDQQHPVIYNDIVVWEDERTFLGEIYGYNFSTGEEFQITPRDSGWWAYPVIYGEIIVWGEWTLDSRIIIAGYDLSESRKFQIFRDFFYLCELELYRGMRVTIYEDIILWTDYRNCNWDIYGYNMRTRQEFQVTTDVHDQGSPALYKDTVVWQDERNGNADIYGASLLSSATPVFFNYRVKVILICFFCGILTALPALGSVWKETLVKRTVPERAPEEPKNFRRSTIPSILFVLAAVVPLSFILYDIILETQVTSSDLSHNVVVSMLRYLIPFFLSSYFIYLAVWFTRNPYVCITDKEITVFTHGKHKEVMNWDTIQEINFSRHKVTLVSSSGKKTEIYLLLVDKRDRKDLVQVLKHFP